MPETDTDLAAIRRHHGFHRLAVREVVAETADAASFVLDVPDDLADVFAYAAGQFCTFRVPVEGEPLLRCYSMSSAPGIDPHLTVTVKRVPDGAVSNWLIDHVAPGDELEVTPPAGVFCIDEASDAPVVAFAGGSGITPVVSIVARGLETTGRSFELLYANRDADSVIFADRLHRLAADHPDRLAVRHHHDAVAGYLSPDAVTAVAAPHVGEATFLICGPTPFMDLVEGALLAAGVPGERILLERFGEPPAEHLDDEGDDTVDATVVTIVLDGSRHEVPHHVGDTLLLTARRADLRPPSSCEAGNCATCMAQVTSGSATMATNNALTPEEVEEGWVLTCQAVPTTAEVTVTYDAL